MEKLFKKITKWYDGLWVEDESHEVQTATPTRIWKPDHSLGIAVYPESDLDIIAYETVDKMIFDYRNNPLLVMDNELAYKKVVLEIFEKDRDMLFRSKRYNRMVWSLLGHIDRQKREYSDELLEYINKEVDKELVELSKEKSTDINPIIDITDNCPLKFSRGQKIIATYHAYCTGTIIKRLKRKKHHFFHTSDGMGWWWLINVHEALGERHHCGSIEVPECCLQDLKKYVERENELRESDWHKEQMNDPRQRSAGLSLQHSAWLAEVFLKS